MPKDIPPPLLPPKTVLFKTIPSPPVPRLTLQKGAHRSQIAFVAKEIGSLGALRPELNGIRERVHGLTVATDEGAAEINVLKLMLFRLQVGDLSDVIAIEDWGRVIDCYDVTWGEGVWDWWGGMGVDV